MFFVNRNLILALAAVAVAGCATQVRYQKDGGSTQEQLLKDRYDCLRETQQRVSSASINAYGGAADSSVMPSCSAFAACMASRGYVRSDKGNVIVPDSARIECK